MHKVDVALLGETGKHFMRPVHHELIPSHVRDFEIAWRKMSNAPRKKSQSWHFAPFFGDFIERLHAETDTGEFLALSDFFADDVRETVAGEVIHGILHRTDTREDQGFRFADFLRITGDDDIKTGPGGSTHDVRQISCIVINDGYFHQSTPLVDNTVSPSMVTASFSAWPMPLKRDSTM